ncbi:MAG: glycosyltransferase family 2 protein, partial [Proteobacteria bacterium]|nr:glycosyltransferase family 2 protein [Pseudomonadota bacterium]
MSDQGLTIFVPVYNEEDILVENTDRLAACLSELAGSPPFEIILGDNGSTDRTPALAASLSEKDPRVRWFSLPEKGVGAAFVRGVSLASYPAFITVDMDLSIDLAFIPAALELLKTHDIVIGSKICGQQKRPFHRKFASNLFIRLAGVLLDLPFQDYSIAAKGWRTEVARRYLALVDDLTFYVVRMVHQAKR